MHRTSKHICRSLALMALVCGCGDDDPEVTGVTVYPDDYYGYAYYYPADLAYSVPYWVDDWYDYPYLYSDTQPQPLTDTSGRTAGSLLRALAIGEELCPGQVTIVTLDTKGCGGDDSTMRGAATITFNNCMLEDGTLLDGMVDFNSRRSFSNATCDESTVASVTFTSKITDFVQIAPSGARLLIPTLTAEGSYSRLFLARPAAISLANSGTLEHQADGAASTVVDLAGSFGVVLGQPPDTWDYRIYGPLSLEDTKQGRSVTATAVDLIHEQACCHPISGSLRLSDTDTGNDSVLTFGPACGAGMLNEDPVSLPACP
jgi:hypothetical protein